MRFSWCVFPLLMMSFVTSVAHGQTETQFFDSEADASASGWAATNVDPTPPPDGTGSDLGWKDSMLAGGSAGGGGGIFSRGRMETRYADLTLAGVLTLDDQMHASGKIWLENINYDGSFGIGFFDSSADTRFFGAVVREGNGDSFRTAGIIRAQPGVGSATENEILPGSTPLEFELDYNPDIGNGEVKYTVREQGGAELFSTSFDIGTSPE